MSRRTRGQWFSASSLLGKRPSKRADGVRCDARRLRLESLEDRRMLAAVGVSNASSAVNGDTSSIAALVANHGGDGISFHEAVLATNATSGADKITFAASLASAVIYTVNVAITDDLVIEGPPHIPRSNTSEIEGGGPVILSGPSFQFHQFMGGGRILDVAAGVTVSITRLSFRNGNATDPSLTGDSYGGAIRNAGSLTVRDSLFYNNGAGEMYNPGAGGGGAISNSGTLEVIGSSFASNYAVYGSGGAIHNAGTATVTNSTFIHNLTGVSGGALFNGAGGVMTVTNCTMVENGGNANAFLFGWPVGSGGIGNQGTMTLGNTIVDNTTLGADVENGGVLTGSHNFIGDVSGALPATLTGNPMLTAPAYDPGPALLPMPMSGGPTFTLPPLVGSPCIDAGDNASTVSAKDQRNAPRVNNGVVDIGAVEIGLASIVVTTLVDEDDGAIDPALGAGVSLREALSAYLPEESLITFAPGLTGTIALVNEPLPRVIDNGLMTIVGPGADLLTIDGAAVEGGGDRGGIFTKGSGQQITISGLTFANGRYGNGENGGGAIHSRGLITVIDCAFVDNTSVNYGGAIYSRSTVAVNCEFTGNSAVEGGAIQTDDGRLEVHGSTFTGNSALLNGGAIVPEHVNRYPDLPYFPSTVTDSTFIGNSAGRDGGAIMHWSPSTVGSYWSELIVTGCTFVDNAAGWRGGAIHNMDTLTLTNSTLIGNSAANTGNLFEVVGGGIDVGGLLGAAPFVNSAEAGRGSVILKNNIVAESTMGLDVFLSDPTFVGPFSGGYNLVGDGSGGLPNTIVGDPLLGPLQDNGGPTWTMVPLAGSLAINGGDPTYVAGAGGVPLYDQRGENFERVLGGRIDIGAVEAPSGDFDANGAVDGFDFLLWQRQFSSTATPSGGGADGDGSGTVDAVDLGVWTSQFGQSSVAATPLALLAIVEQAAAVIANDLPSEDDTAVIQSSSWPAAAMVSDETEVDAALVALAQAESGFRLRGVTKSTDWRALRAANSAAHDFNAATKIASRSTNTIEGEGSRELELVFTKLGECAGDAAGDDFSRALVKAL